MPFPPHLILNKEMGGCEMLSLVLRSKGPTSMALPGRGPELGVLKV